MPSHPRYKGQSFSSEDPRSNGAFSRRHKTGEAHEAAQSEKMARESEFWATIARNKAARAARTDVQQIALLDKMLGKGKGAKKERKRLNARIAKAKG